MKRLYRDQFDKKIAGVCGGLAQYFNFDSSLIRLIFILLTLLTGGVLLLVYLILWAVLPLGPKAYVIAHYRKFYRSKTDRRIAGVCGGLAQYFKVDSNILRLCLIVVAFLTGFFPVLILYIIAIGIVPEAP